MAEVTYDDMLPETRALLAEGTATLYDWSNCAFGCHGWHVHALVRRGLWEKLKEHVSDDPMQSYSVYGPAKRSTPLDAASKGE